MKSGASEKDTLFRILSGALFLFREKSSIFSQYFINGYSLDRKGSFSLCQVAMMIFDCELYNDRKGCD